MPPRRTVTVDLPINGRKGVEGEVFLQLCSLSNCPTSLAAKLLYEAGEWLQLLQLKIDPFFAEWNGYSPQEFQLGYQVTAFFSKYVGLDTGIDLERVAFDKWVGVEARCRSVNNDFRLRWDGKQAFDPQVEQIIAIARSKIRRILGSVTEVDLRYIKEMCHFGPGADTDTEREFTSRFFKFSDPGSVTPACSEMMSSLFGSEFLQCDSIDGDEVEEEPSRICEFLEHAELVRESRLAFVAKNAKTHRSICVEPRWNIFFQLGIGALLTKRLLRFGIDITDQTVNQLLAKRAEVSRLATIDLSSASDSLAINLVIDLLADADPFWLELLLTSRCTHTFYERADASFRLEKISSMGNGYTFPLETLIFFSLAWAACEVLGHSKSVKSDVSVYGDDIIVPQAVATGLVEALNCLGFSVNPDKTYLSGVFYESCGQDYYKGKNVRPFFVKEEVVTVTQAITFCNQIAAFSCRLIGVRGFAFGKVWDIRELVIRRIPKHLRCFGPPEAGDGVIHDTFDRALPAVRRDQNRSLSGFWVRCLIAVSIPVSGRDGRPIRFQKERDFYPHLFSKLSGVVDTKNLVYARDSVYYRLGDVYCLRYTDTIPI